MTAVADLLRPADRDRLLARLDQLRDLGDAMRKPGGLPAVPEPPALCQMARRRQRRNRTDKRRQ